MHELMVIHSIFQQSHREQLKLCKPRPILVLGVLILRSHCGVQHPWKELWGLIHVLRHCQAVGLC